MNDRMTTATQSYWRKDTPDPGIEYEVWFHNGYRDAVCRNGQWYDARTGSWLPAVTHWRNKTIEVTQGD